MGCSSAETIREAMIKILNKKALSKLQGVTIGKHFGVKIVYWLLMG
jgi:hypothetical protein